MLRESHAKQVILDLMGSFEGGKTLAKAERTARTVQAEDVRLRGTRAPWQPLEAQSRGGT